MKRNYGFTLLEVLIALSLLAVGVMAVMKLFPLSLRQAQGAAERTVASQLADTKFGILRARGDENITPDAFSYMYNGIPSQDGIQRPDLMFTMESLSDINDIYTVYQGYGTNLQRMGGVGESGLHRVVFSVTMNDGRRERFVTYLARP